MTRQVVVSILGGFKVLSDDAMMRIAPSGQRVIAYLAVRDTPATRSQVAGNVWVDMPEERAAANLRTALWRLRQPGIQLVDTIGQRLTLARHVEVDLRRMRQSAHDLLSGQQPGEPWGAEGLASAGELLDDWGEDWVLVERERFRQLRLQALERVTAFLASAGDFARAATTALAAVSTEPLRESAHRALISVHIAQGNSSEAIRQYVVYRKLMREELNLAPSVQMQQLIGLVSDRVLERMESSLRQSSSTDPRRSRRSEWVRLGSRA